MSGRHARSREPRAHWLLLIFGLPVLLAILLFQGWTTNAVDGVKTRTACTTPVPNAVAKGGPVLHINGDNVRSTAMPAGTVALTFDGGPDPVWTPRILALLRKHHVHATFFLYGAQAARYPDLVRQIRADGNDIGSNTYTGADLGSQSAFRTRMELSLTQKALAGAAGVHTKLLRMPETTTPATMCGGEWKAAHRAAADGYLLVAADRPTRKPALGAIRQYSQTEIAYRETEKLLSDRNVKHFSTVTAALRQTPANTAVSGSEHWQGNGLIWVTAFGRVFAHGMTWVLAIVGALGALRLVLLVAFARAQVRRVERYRPGSPWLREVTAPVSVLVPAYNEEAGIAHTIRSLLASTHGRIQLIVIDDGSKDRTSAIAAQIDDPRVMVIRQANAGKAAALNTGLAYAVFDIVVMVDADTVFEPDAIYRLIQPLAHPAVGAVSGNTKVGNRRGLLGRWQHLEYVFGFNLDRRMFEVLECMPTVPGAIGAFRRDALMGVGGVSEDTLAEDTDLTMAMWRAGWRVVYEESAVSWTEVPGSLRQLWRQRYRWCYGTIQAMWKHRHAFLEVGSAGRFGRRALTYLAFFQIGLPLLAPVIDVFALYGGLFLDPIKSAAAWITILGIQLAGAAYALRLDGERLRTLWAMPFQLFFYRQLSYLVIIQSVVAFLLGSKISWRTVTRSGTAAQHIGEPVAASRELSSR